MNLSSSRVQIKRLFDNLVYKYPTLNKVLRNLNKRLSFLTQFKLRPFGVLTVRLNSGITFKMATNETSTVTKKIFWYGADNYEYTKIFECITKRASTFFDVGSSIGYYSLLASKTNPNTRVFAFEPASAPYHFLIKNIQLNNLKDTISAYPLALSEKQGMVEFFEFRSKDKSKLEYNLGGAGSLKINFESQRLNTVPVEVPCDTMDNFCIVNNIPFPDLIKMDTEGTENMVLSGASQILMNKPIIICETLFNTIEPELDTIMKSYGYDFYNFKNNRLAKVNTLVRKEDNGVRDCFFVHPHRFNWVKEFVQD